MKTQIVRIDENLELDKQLIYPVNVIKKGGLVAFPTETVYGLGASALNEDASRKIYAAKGRPSDNPLIVHISKPEDAENYCYTDDIFYKLAKEFMPGPITIIMKKKDIIPSTITGGLDTVGIRCPENKIANKLIELSGVPIAAPSANISGKPSPTKAQHVIDDLNGKIDCIIDGGESIIGVESTIVKIENGECTLLRPGGITISQLKKVFTNIKIDKAVLSKLDANERPQAPGMKYRHYSPDASISLIVRKDQKDNDNKIISFINNIEVDDNIGFIIPKEFKTYIKSNNVFVFGSIKDEREQAQQLYDILRRIDKTNIKELYAVINDIDDDIGLAIYNRMLKASGYNIIEV